MCMRMNNTMSVASILPLVQIEAAESMDSSRLNDLFEDLGLNSDEELQKGTVICGLI